MPQKWLDFLKSLKWGKRKQMKKTKNREPITKRLSNGDMLRLNFSISAAPSNIEYFTQKKDIQGQLYLQPLKTYYSSQQHGSYYDPFIDTITFSLLLNAIFEGGVK